MQTRSYKLNHEKMVALPVLGRRADGSSSVLHLLGRQSFPRLLVRYRKPSSFWDEGIGNPAPSGVTLMDTSLDVSERAFPESFN